METPLERSIPFSPSKSSVLLNAETVIDKANLPCPTFVSWDYWEGSALGCSPERLLALLESASIIRQRLHNRELGMFEVHVENSKLTPKGEAHFMALLKSSKRHGVTLTISERRYFHYPEPYAGFPSVQGGVSWEAMMRFVADDDPEFFVKCDDD
jgi:hypothetical protein